jgi:predicted exporter
MNNRIPRIGLWVLFAIACVYLVRVDYSTKLETDVSSLLPEVETDEARLARRLISDEQGRAVYLELKGLPVEDIKASEVEQRMLNPFRDNPLVASIVRVDQNLNLNALKLVGDHCLELLFPRWLVEKQKQFANLSDSSGGFVDWAVESAVEDMEDFLASPVAMEMARPELMDPLLLNINNILALSESGSGGMLPDQSESNSTSRLYWLTLAQSALSKETQLGFVDLVTGIEMSLPEGVELHYGGLLKLAAASRDRIQSDIIKINLLSVLGVLVISWILLRQPWRLLLAIPTLLAGVVGAAAVSFLVFDRVNALVLVVGSILIGTAIDYAIHLIFSEKSENDFPTRKLVGLACVSTVAGFLILLFAELQLIRQIGVFVGAGLLCAYLMASVSYQSGGASGTGLRGFKKTHETLFGIVFAIGILVGGYGLIGLDWKDDIRNLEAPSSKLISEDVALREKFGSNDSGSLFLTTGESYLTVFENESRFMESVNHEPGVDPGFGVSRFLPSASQVAAVSEFKTELARFFAEVKTVFTLAGYDLESFGDFFVSATTYGARLGSVASETEALIQRFGENLQGPLSGVIGEYNGRYWSLSSMNLPVDLAAEITAEQDRVVQFSQLGFLNRTLEHHRNTLFYFGSLAMALVSVIMLISLGIKKGILVVAYPLLAGVCAIGISHLCFGSLNMFHLIGCFLGGAIALDYALFAMESYARKRDIPNSVWLSAGTTTASFMALSFSAIPVVQSLGVMVALLACFTLLALHSSKTILVKYLSSNDSN